MSNIQIELSQVTDAEKTVIQNVFLRTFSDSEGENEGKTIGKLVNDLLTTTPKQELHVFVAKIEQDIVGSIILTPLKFDSGQVAYLLSPVATLTAHQGKGIAQALINKAKEYLATRGIKYLFTYGDPAFYGKVGFEQVGVDDFTPPHTLSMPIGWLAQSLTSEKLQPIVGKSTCAEGLDNPAYW